MKASIITPTLNAVRFITACIANVAAQGDAVAEHVIVDGGSTDGTVEAIEALARGNPRLVLIPGPDRGQSDALNKASARARGDVIGILNADDFYQPGTVAAALGRLDHAQAPAMVAGDCLVLDAQGRPLMWNRPSDLRIESLLLGWDHAQFPCNPSAYFYRRSVHDRVGGYDVDDHFAMDLDFVLRCAALDLIRYVPEHWGNFRVMPGTKTYDDRHGPARRAAIYARHAARLTPAQQTTMTMMRSARLALDQSGTA